MRMVLRNFTAILAVIFIMSALAWLWSMAPALVTGMLILSVVVLLWGMANASEDKP